MKAYHYLIILAAALGILYCIAIGKNKKTTTNSQKPKDDKNPSTSTASEDKSENADVATVTYEEALALAEKYEDFMLYQDLGDAPEYKWTISYTDENGEEHNEIISQFTFETLVEKGYEADYN